jgi:EAL and modified HD-GYP domain-containing signal transduction protein
MEPDTAFTLGLFSLLDAMLDMPIDEVCARVNLPKELTQAITENAGVYGQHLKALMQWEKGAADTIDWASLEVTPGELEASIEQAIHTVSQQSGDLGL